MKPNVFVVGTSKSGTTSLYHWLKNHSDVFVSDSKESHYFSSAEILGNTNGVGDGYIAKTVDNSLSKYYSRFSSYSGQSHVVDVSPSYFYYHKKASAKIYEFNDQSKIVIILRNPVEKIYSQYLHLVREGRETESFESALKLESYRKKNKWSDMWLYEESGYYYDSVKSYIELFGESNVLVLFHSELKASHNIFMTRISDFLGIQAEDGDDTLKQHNKAAIPKNVYFARYVTGGPIYMFAKKVIPSKLGGFIRRYLVSLNSVNTLPKIDENTKIELAKIYNDDIVKLAYLLNIDEKSLKQKLGFGG